MGLLSAPFLVYYDIGRGNMFFMKIIMKIIISLAVIFGLYVVGSILLAVITDYNPDKIMEIEIKGEGKELIQDNESIDLMIFNIGYCGLDEGQDFFMDGGKSSRGKSKEKVSNNLEKIVEFLNLHKADILMLQEVDTKGDRSYDVNQLKFISDNYAVEGSSAYAINYNVKWVPVPFLRPMGGATSGLFTTSKYEISEARRLALPINQSVPKKYFELDRCLLESVIPVSNGKKLYCVNVHLSAFDKGGTVRKKQLEFLKNYLKEIRANDDYVILGGDWNHILNDALNDNFDEMPDWIVELPKEFKVEGFSMYAPEIATVRANEISYQKGKTFESIIDGFYVSDNIEIINIEGFDLAFENSDHNPVRISIKLK